MALHSIKNMYCLLFGVVAMMCLLDFSAAQRNITSFYTRSKLNISEDIDVCDNDVIHRSVCNMSCEVNFDSNRFPQRIAEYTCIPPAGCELNSCSFPTSHKYGCVQVKSIMTVFRAHNCNNVTEYRAENFKYRSGCICEDHTKTN
ncbi:uncharacterized protein LOC118766492 [Octopus sinensis]|uniref:Uncharacterized protein LOC118766492 n=1 Tax=Octopus sinensis TaxID=2607531 RepID=A0A7E6FEK6_9MOLL|nr:uncharacterized protein LOC118766492 [Octopus sinensis]